jgi:hypothetical protein
MVYLESKGVIHRDLVSTDMPRFRIVFDEQDCLAEI